MWNYKQYSQLEQGHVYQNVSTTSNPSTLSSPTSIIFTTDTFLGSSSSDTVEVMIEPDEAILDEAVVAWKYAVRPYLDRVGQKESCYWAEANTDLDVWGSDSFSVAVPEKCGCICGGIPIDVHKV